LSHTPGPWRYGLNCIQADNGVVVVDALDMTVADARLIAAAPELLLVAQLFVSPDWNEEEGAHALYDIARAAIAKATEST
jgi:hypothetical protein